MLYRFSLRIVKPRKGIDGQPDFSLGDLSISEISVLELPICLSDLYDSEPYTKTQPSKQSQLVIQRRGRLRWSSGGRLHSAVKSENEFVLRTLLNLGADIEEKDPGRRTPLSCCVRSYNGLEIFRLLLDRGAIVDTPDSSGRTPLLYSALPYFAGKKRSLDISKLLLNRGAMVDTPDSSGRTPLSYSAGARERFGPEILYLDICKLLVDNGAKVDTHNSSGNTPYWHADQVGNNRICQYITEIGGQNSK